MKLAKTTTVRLPGHRADDDEVRRRAEEIIREAAKTDPLLQASLDRRCSLGMACERGPFDPPKRCAKCDRSLR